MPMVLLGNKGDMVHLRQVSSEEGNFNGNIGGGYGNGNTDGGYAMAMKMAIGNATAMVLLGNKGDMVHLRQVSSEEGDQYGINDDGNGGENGGDGDCNCGSKTNGACSTSDRLDLASIFNCLYEIGL